MGKQTAQGTRWESQIVKELRERGESANRQPKTGKKGEPDVISKHRTPSGAWPPNVVHVLAWKRLTPSDGGKRRSPMGEPLVAVLPWDQFMYLVEDCEFPVDVYIQAKAAQTVSVTKVLWELRDWWRQHGN